MKKLLIVFLFSIVAMDALACIQDCSRGKEVECEDIVNQDGEVLDRKCRCVSIYRDKKELNEYQSCARGKRLQCAKKREGQRQPDCQCVDVE